MRACRISLGISYPERHLCLVKEYRMKILQNVPAFRSPNFNPVNMSKVFMLLSILFLAACGGSLSDEQRKKIKEDMKQHKIVRVTDAEITAAAFAKGRGVMEGLKSTSNKNLNTDSLEAASHTKITWIAPGAKNALEMEQQLIEAYLESFINGGLTDNVQRLETDSLLYTYPVTEKLADGSENVKGMWSIRLSKKDLILSMDK